MWSRPWLSVPAMTRPCPEIGTFEPSPQGINWRSDPRRPDPSDSSCGWPEIHETNHARMAKMKTCPSTVNGLR